MNYANKKQNSKISDYFIMFFVLALVFTFVTWQVLFYVGSEQPLYSWDYKRSWKMWEHMGLILRELGLGTILVVYDSAQTSDYNYSSVALLAPFSSLALDSRSAYILAISICYFIPFSLLVFCTLSYFNHTNSPLIKIFSLITIIFFSSFWRATLRGIPDIVGLISILIALNIVIRYDLTGKSLFKKVALIGFLLWVISP